MDTSSRCFVSGPCSGERRFENYRSTDVDSTLAIESLAESAGELSERTSQRKRTSKSVLVIKLLGVLGGKGLPSSAAAPDIGIWRAAASGNTEAIKQHLLILARSKCPS